MPQQSFNKKARPLSEAERALREWGISYVKRGNGSILIPGDLHLDDRNLTQLPDLSRVTVKGSFSCHGNHLTTLKGAPKKVGGSFTCSCNRLTSLEGAPQKVLGEFTCHENRLTTLKGAPQIVAGDFSCGYNKLNSLDGGPQSIGGSFFCHVNRLTSLKGLPPDLAGKLYCLQNALTSLEGVPAAVKNVECDFGTFMSCDEIPQELRLSPETRARLEQSDVLENNLQVRRPLKLRPFGNI